VGSSGDRRGNKGKVYEGGLMVPAILEWPARIPKHRVTNIRCCTYDIYPTLLDIVGVKMKDQPVLDGVSLLPLIDGQMEKRGKPLGFWDYPIAGISTPSAKWMGDLLMAQQAGKDLEPHASSQNAAKLPSPKYPTDQFPGHAAWIDGDWKLHRIASKQGKVTWELYNLAEDPKEKTDLINDQPDRVKSMKPALDAWLKSVAESLNGEDYAKQ
ncbi:MAG: N-acetylgalactosamine 6-sulfate sulfatase, partial [Planctomycetaceae bacterium]|nr:N-acetylgalactosamine 6-sulfate sulfatase [Planctomycetaceae bacterium]